MSFCSVSDDTSTTLAEERCRSCQGSTYRNFCPQNLIADWRSICRAGGGVCDRGIDQQCFFQSLFHHITISVGANSKGNGRFETEKLGKSESDGGELHCVIVNLRALGPNDDVGIMVERKGMHEIERG